MKIKCIAVFLSLISMAFAVQAAPPLNQPSVTKVLLDKNKSSTQKVDLNKADLPTLTGSFKGVGKKRAQAIIAYRDSHHGFKSIEELADVKGFGQRFLDKNREKLKEVYFVQ
jgi:competence protein ComEA